jgi:hypothetical protein
MPAEEGLELPLLGSVSDRGSVRSSIVSSFDTKEVSQGFVFTCGLYMFAGGYIAKLWHAHLPHYDYHGIIAHLVYALLQTGGLLTMTTADVSVNAYLSRRPATLFLFLAILLGYTATIACTPPQPISEVYWIEVAPFFYLSLRFTSVMQMHDNFPRFTVSFVRLLGLTSCTIDSLPFARCLISLHSGTLRLISSAQRC